MKRTHRCNELSISHVGQIIVLNGWVNKWRNLGGVIFIDLRDRYGITQVIFEPSIEPQVYELSKSLRSEYVIAIKGTVEKRPAESVNKKLQTGEIEVHVRELAVLNQAKTPPFEISEHIDVTEEIRLRYRYLDLRRPVLLNNLVLRSKVYRSVRNFFHDHDFVEIETPVLMKSTPEGARDFLVPSRNYPGKFYALPQSPQTYKQLLMVAGMDRYFQIVKCFRDEDQRKDRQAEFTQIDVEMSFIDEEDIIDLASRMVQRVFRETIQQEITLPLRRMSFTEAFETYGVDKPDLRFDLKIVKLNRFFRATEFSVFKNVLEGSGEIAGIIVPKATAFSRKKIDELSEQVFKMGAKGLATLKFQQGEFSGTIAKFLSQAEKQELTGNLGLRDEDLLLMVADTYETTFTVLGQLRLLLGEELGLIDNTRFEFLWITDFPLLEYSPDEKRYVARHHPFTSPKLDQMKLLADDPGKVEARAYDLVLNGFEIAGGSIRIHTRDIQELMFKALNISAEEAEKKFGFLMKAFEYGAPPHGGIAFGLDRMVMLMTGADSIRDVMAFPKTSSGLSLMDDCPSEVSAEQLTELKISIR